jgi:hypothetical protein
MPKTQTTDAVADAMREVAMRLEKAVADGFHSRAIRADDLVEMLLATADRLDPPVRATKRDR